MSVPYKHGGYSVILASAGSQATVIFLHFDPSTNRLVGQFLEMKDAKRAYNSPLFSP